MSTFAIRQKLIDIARKDVGKKEVTRNRAPFITAYWPDTSYPEGYQNREPYCAAAVCHWVAQWLRLPEVAAAFGKTVVQLETWRCKSARAFDWQDWARSKGLLVMNDSPENVLHTGDIMVFDMSHIGLVVDDYDDRVKTIEANTGATGGNDGDGVWEKDRPRSLAKCFIRLLP